MLDLYELGKVVDTMKTIEVYHAFMVAEIAERVPHFFEIRLEKGHAHYDALLAKHPDKHELKERVTASKAEVHNKIKVLKEDMMAKFTELYNAHHASAATPTELHKYIYLDYEDKMTLIWYVVADNDVDIRKWLNDDGIPINNLFTHHNPCDWVIIPEPAKEEMSNDFLIQQIVDLLSKDHASLGIKFKESIIAFGDQLKIPAQPSKEFDVSNKMLKRSIREASTRMNGKMESFPITLKEFLEDKIQDTRDIFELIMQGYTKLYQHMSEIGHMGDTIRSGMLVANYEDNVTHMNLNV